MTGNFILPELVHVPHLGVEKGEESEEEVGAYQIGEVERDVPPRSKGFFRQLNKLFNSGTVQNFVEQCPS